MTKLQRKWNYLFCVTYFLLQIQATDAKSTKYMPMGYDRYAKQDCISQSGPSNKKVTILIDSI